MIAAVVGGALLSATLSGCGSFATDLQDDVSDALAGANVADEGNTNIMSFDAGDCINDAELDPDAELVQSIDLVDCDQPHDSEVIGLVTIAGDVYPGEVAVSDAADPLCRTLFETWTGGGYEEQPDLDYGFYTPTEDGWQLGDHDAMCIIYGPEQLTGTTQGATSRG